jgi:tetratricopeptide (TPR) repeat protein
MTIEDIFSRQTPDQGWGPVRGGGWVLVLCAGLVLSGCRREEATRTPPELLRSGWTHFRLDEFAEAQGDFQKALEGLAPGAPLRLNALYGLALLASLAPSGDPARYRSLLRQLVDEDKTPTHEMAAWAALALARSHAIAGDADAEPGGTLSREYTEVAREYPQTAAAQEAFLQRTLLLVRTNKASDAATAIGELQAFLEAHPDSPYRSPLLSLLSSAYYTRQQYPAALRAAIDSLNAKESDPANPRQNNILEYYRIGVMAEFDVGDFATARAYYQRFIEEYPHDQRVFNVQLLLKHLDETEARLRAGLPPTELSALALREKEASR